MADEISPDHLKAARETLNAVKVTTPFDNILPSLAEQLKGTLIQSSPNYQELINATVDEKALSLAPRRADLEKEAANIYAKIFTQEELLAITAFYNSPAGKKLLTDGPIATRELSKAADIWAAGISRDLAQQSDAASKPPLRLKRRPRLANSRSNKPCRLSMTMTARVFARAFLLPRPSPYEGQPET